MHTSIPQSVENTLWSYDVSKFDTARDKKRIILQTLNNGSSEAVAWLKKTYSREDLREIVRNSSAGEWSNKSLNYWSLMLDSKPERAGRFS